MNHILTADAMIQVFSHLNLFDLVHCLKVSKYWNELANNPSIWRLVADKFKIPFSKGENPKIIVIDHIDRREINLIKKIVYSCLYQIKEHTNYSAGVYFPSLQETGNKCYIQYLKGIKFCVDSPAPPPSQQEKQEKIEIPPYKVKENFYYIGSEQKLKQSVTNWMLCAEKWRFFYFATEAKFDLLNFGNHIFQKLTILGEYPQLNMDKKTFLQAKEILLNSPYEIEKTQIPSITTGKTKKSKRLRCIIN